MPDSADIISVTQTVNLYAIALDARCFDLFERVFTADVKSDFGGGAVFQGLHALVDAFRIIHEPFHSTQHIVSGHTVRIGGDKAWCLSYVHGYFTRVIDGGLCVFDSTGWYDDILVRADDHWLIADRVSRMVTANGDQRVMGAMPGVDVDFKLLPLHEEASEGRVRFLPNA